MQRLTCERTVAGTYPSPLWLERIHHHWDIAGRTLPMDPMNPYSHHRATNAQRKVQPEAPKAFADQVQGCTGDSWVMESVPGWGVTT